MSVIRKFHNDDVPELKIAFEANTPSFFAVNEWKDFTDFLKNHKSTYFVLVEDGHVAGGGGYYFPDEFTGRLSWDFIHPAWKGRGSGTRLIEICIESMQSFNTVQKIVVHTSQKAEMFYRRFGFRTRSIEQDHWAPGLDLYYMVLSPPK